MDRRAAVAETGKVYTGTSLSALVAAFPFLKVETTAVAPRVHRLSVRPDRNVQYTARIAKVKIRHAIAHLSLRMVHVQRKARYRRLVRGG